MIDLHSSEQVEVHISADGKKLWINTEEGCQLRIYCIGKLELVDERENTNEAGEG